MKENEEVNMMSGVVLSKQMQFFSCCLIGNKCLALGNVSGVAEQLSETGLI